MRSPSASIAMRSAMNAAQSGRAGAARASTGATSFVQSTARLAQSQVSNRRARTAQTCMAAMAGAQISAAELRGESVGHRAGVNAWFEPSVGPNRPGINTLATSVNDYMFFDSFFFDIVSPYA